MALGYAAIVYPVLNVNAKTLGTSVILPPLSGKKFLTIKVLAHAVSSSGSGPSAEATVGTNDANYDNVIGAGQPLPASAGEIRELVRDCQALQLADLTTSGLKAKITDVGNFTTHVVDFYIVGIIV